MSTSQFISCDNIAIRLKATYPRRWWPRRHAPRNGMLVVDIRLVVSTFQEESDANASDPVRVVEDRLVEPALSGHLDDSVHAMLASATRESRGVHPDVVLFLSRKIALFASSALLRGLTRRGAHSCTLEVRADVHERSTPELAILEPGWPLESELGGGGGGFGGVPASDEAIEAVQATTYAEDGHGVRETMCAVCTEDFVAGEELRVMPCAHAFHRGCLDPWLKMSHVCPVCRFPIATQEAA